jgi:hypothetical protein
LVAKFKIQENDIPVPKEKSLKLQEDGTRKVGVQNKAGINLKNTEPSPPGMSCKTFVARPAGREMGQYAQGVRK